MTENTLRDRLRDLAKVGQPDALADRALARAKRMRRRHVALAAGAALALVAIGVPALLALRPGPAPVTVAGGTGDPGAQAVVQGGDVWTSCDAVAPDGSRISADAAGLARLADDFVPVAAVVCDEQHIQHADGREELVALERRADEIAALVAAVRLPDIPGTGNPCTLELRVVRWFAFLDADGRWVRPGLPTEECGKIRMEVVNAAASLETSDVSSRVIRVLVTAEQAATGCVPSWSDVVAMHTRTSGASQSLPTAPALPGGEVRLCVYTVPVNQQGTDKPVGEVVSGGVFDADRVAAIAAALPQLPLAQECDRSAGSFAILFTSRMRADVLYVELDGCRRILMYAPSDGRVWLGQADEAFLALLDS